MHATANFRIGVTGVRARRHVADELNLESEGV